MHNQSRTSGLRERRRVIQQARTREEARFGNDGDESGERVMLERLGYETDGLGIGIIVERKDLYSLGWTQLYSSSQTEYGQPV